MMLEKTLLRVYVVTILAALSLAGCKGRQQGTEAVATQAEEQVMVASSLPFSERYAIVVGAYRQGDAARRKVRELEEKGYKAYVFTLSNKLRCVAVLPMDDIVEALDSLESLRNRGIAPPEGFIFTNDQKR